MKIDKESQELLKTLNQKYDELVDIRNKRNVSYTFENQRFFISGRSLCEVNKSIKVSDVINKEVFFKNDLNNLLKRKIENVEKIIELENIFENIKTLSL